MQSHHPVAVTRAAFNPVLADEPVIEEGLAPASVFYTPLAQRVEEHLPLLIGLVAGLFLLIAWILSRIEGAAPLTHLFTLLAFVTGGVPAMRSVWASLRNWTINIDVLMLLGAGLAAIVGSAFEGALLLFLFALSGGLEQYALRRTQTAIHALRRLSPLEATLIENGDTRRVPLRQVGIGATILVRPGEKVPLDGTVEEGASAIDESAITGESVPRDAEPGDEVFAGTQNLDGRLVVRATRLAGDSTLARVISMVTDAKHRPTRVQRLIDRIGPTYSIVVITASITAGLVGRFLLSWPAAEAVHRAIALLIVASPCALIIATPVAYLSAIAAAARQGVLIKGGQFLEVIAKTAAVVFDKTGTLTTGRIALTDILAPNGFDETEALRLVGGVERSSNHPLAAAVNEALARRGLNPCEVSEYLSEPGAGASAMCEGHRVWIGRPDHAARHVGAPILANAEPASPTTAKDHAETAWQDRATALRQEGKTVSALVIDGAIGLLAFRDTIREESRHCLDALRAQGAGHLVMLTGDHQIVAARVAEQLALDGYQAGLKPEDKLSAAEALRTKHGPIVMVGDGINDAPALAGCDVGIALGAMGAGVALEAAHVVLMNDRIETIAWLHRHAKRTAAIVKQNLAFAIGVITVLSVFAVTGHIPLPLAVVGHEGSTLLVALNALRLLRRGT